MSHSQSHSLTQEKFLLLSVNLLHKSVLEPTRTEAKRFFKSLEQGHSLPLAEVAMEDQSTARFAVSLDHSEFRGRLNFTGFRASLVALVANISQALREGRELTVFDSQQGDDSQLFGITGATLEGGQPNVMMLGVGHVQSQDVTLLRLLYMDPSQFSGDNGANTA